jgi:lambda repressor-like predicted transcriptional regulator
VKQSEILPAIRDGIPLPPMVEVVSGVWVWADALRIDGVRVAVSARTAQLVADALGMSLTTAALEDEIWRAAAIRLEPATFSPTRYRIDAWETTVRHSAAVDAQLAGTAAVEGDLVACVGKAWVLDDRLAARPGRAANYGWHSERRAPYRPVTAGLPNVWQPLAFAHNLDHFDYSQTLRLAALEPDAELPTHRRDARGDPLRLSFARYPV